MAAIAAAFRGAFPDLRMEVDLILSDGDLVAARWISAGTFSGPWGDTSSTGVRATFSGVNIFRIRDGRVVELWNHRGSGTDGTGRRAGVRRKSRDPEGPTADAADAAGGER